MKGPSTHLSWKELACKDGTPYPYEWRDSRAILLGEIFELIRRECGDKPIVVISAFRTPEHNKKIKGARHSQHLQGRGLDLFPPNGMSTNRFHTKIRSLVSSTIIRGIGRYNTFIHVDIRPSDRLITWRGTGVKDS